MDRGIADRGDPFATLIDLLRFRAAERPDALAHQFWDDERDQVQAWTYAELDRAARTIAARLKELNLQGERALLIYPAGLDYIAAFWGCLYAGVIAAPAYPPRPNRPMPRLRAMAADAQAKVVLTSTTTLAGIRGQRDDLPDLKSLTWLTTDDLSADRAESWIAPTINADQLAFLQYTSGSTGDPRGVMVSHANLLHNLACLREAYAMDSQSMIVTWLPLYHDMGLIGAMLEPIYCGGASTLLSPTAFLRRPASWLEAMGRFRGTHCGAPNFAFELCAEKVSPTEIAKLDLSSLAYCCCGAEPVRAETVQRFADTFAPSGFRREAFRPCFGMAEATLMVTSSVRLPDPWHLSIDRAALEHDRIELASPGSASQQTVNCGHPWRGQRVLVVDPATRLEQPADHIGEIWIQGGSVAAGYWNRAELNEQVFQARLADSGDGPFLRTGDLGFLHQGDLFITGRLKDQIIIRGSKFYPQDIEHTVERAHEALELNRGAAFTIEAQGEERLIVVHELDRQHRRQPTGQVFAAIREAISQRHDLVPNAIVLLRPGSVPMTSSGKIRRRACREAYLAGSLEVVDLWHFSSAALAESTGIFVAESPQEASAVAQTAPTADDIREWLTLRIAERLSIDPQTVDPRDSLDRYGLDSLYAVSLAKQLEGWLGRRVSATLVYEYPTIDQIAKYLSSQRWQTASTGPIQDAAIPIVEPIAIIGLGCRFPGGADNPEAFWHLLRDGVDAVREIPAERWNVDAWYDPDPDASSRVSTRWGGFLDQVDQFDAAFFGISPREATMLDPQHRWLLEVSWEALEHAGIPFDDLAGSDTGVFVGICTDDYSQRMQNVNDPALINPYSGAGSASSMAAGRIAYFLGSHGPAVSVDTACSSALVAVHQACQSLRSSECRMALAGGVNALLSVYPMIYFSKIHAMSATGRCQTFDAAADGYVRGEGCGVVVLKRLADALADGDRVLAVIRGSAVNHGGRSNGIMAPNAPAQEMVIRKALSAAGAVPHDVSYLEAHGTGTPLGDPIEMRALAEVFAPGRDRSAPLYVGSAKTNLGHLEGAAGVVGLIKVVLALQHGEIPPHLHFQRVNPHIPLAELPFEIPTQRIPWTKGARRRLAGISSFGFSGTNAHVLVAEAPEAKRQHRQGDRPLHILTLSAKDGPALRDVAHRFDRNLEKQPDLELADVCFTANTGRSAFAHRLAIVAESQSDLRNKLGRWQTGHESAEVRSGIVSAQQRPKIAFLCTGQGAQYVGMGRMLYESQPTFCRVLDECDEILRPRLGRSIFDVIYPAVDTGLLNETAFTQPALFAIEYALAQLWKTWGIEPDFVLGHSVGQYVAACIANVFSLEDGLKLIAERGRLMQQLPPGGQMAAVFASEEEVLALLDTLDSRLSIAAINGPREVVVSGEADQVDAFLERSSQAGIASQRLNVSHAFHSRLMEPMLSEFARVVQGVALQSSRVPLICNLMAELAGDEIATADYWSRHIRQPVRFAKSMATLAESGVDTYIEIGPKPILLGLGKKCVTGTDAAWLPSLRAAQTDWQTLLQSVSELVVRGAPIDWRGFDGDYVRTRVDLPTYPFQRKRFWLDLPELLPSTTGSLQKRSHKLLHPLLGSRVPSPLKDALFEASISTASLPYLKDHRILDSVLFPATGFCELALAAAAATFSGDRHSIENLVIHQPLVLVGDEAITVQVVVSPGEARTARLQIFRSVDAVAGAESLWVLHAEGTIGAGDSQSFTLSNDAPVNLNGSAQEIPVADFYQQVRSAGLHYGPMFQGVEQLLLGDEVAIGQIRLPESLLDGLPDYHCHPVLLDACLQVVGALVADREPQAFLPVAIGKLSIRGKLGARIRCEARLQSTSEATVGTLLADITLFTEAGALLGRVEGLTLKPVGGTQSLDTSGWLYRTEWQPLALPSNGVIHPPCRWLIFADEDGLAMRVAEQLRTNGDDCELVWPARAGRPPQTNYRTIDPADGLAIKQLITKQCCDKDRPLHGIVYLPSAGNISQVEPTTEELVAAQEIGCEAVLSLIQTISERAGGATPRVWIVTRGSQTVNPGDPLSLAHSPLGGLGRVIALEHPELRCVRVDLDSSTSDEDADHLMHELRATGQENQIAYRSSTRYLARLVSLKSPLGSPEPIVKHDELRQLKVERFGILESLALHTVTRSAPGPHEVQIEVCSSGLNFRDVLNALGMLNEHLEQMGVTSADDLPLGFECAGRIVAVGDRVKRLKVGDEVLSALSIGSLASHVSVAEDFVALKPAEIPFEQAATLPIAFLTAFYGLERLARIGPGDRVLIHAAAGGVGQAAIQIARRAGAQVFATASPAKWEALRAQGIEHVMNSRTADFAEQIMQLTDGRGVDIVLNSLTGEFIPQSVSVLARGGRFVEIGKLGIWTESQMAKVRADIAYHPFDLGEVAQADPDLIREMLAEVVQRIDACEITPLPLTNFMLQDAADAFRFMAQAKQIGKVVVSTLAAEAVTATQRKRLLIRNDRGYLITGGLGALGLHLAKWLVNQNAGEVVLVGRGEPSLAARRKIQQLQRGGSRIRVLAVDVAQDAQVTRLFEVLRESTFPLAGIIHAAGVLDDGVLRQQSIERFRRVIAPKMRGAWNLHRASKGLPLDFFVCFSSVASLIGSPGQGSYAAANAFLDAFAAYRRSRGLPAVTINWGPWAAGGMAGGVSARDRQRWLDQGWSLIPISAALELCAELFEHAAPQVGVVPVEWNRLLAHFSANAIPPFFQQVPKQTPSKVRSKGQSPEALALLAQLRAEATENRLELLNGFLAEQAAQVLRLDQATSLDPRRPFNELGFDSLMAIELKNQLELELNVTVPIAAFFESANLESLAKRLLDQLVETTDGVVVPASLDNPDQLLERLDELSDDDVDRLLHEALAEQEAVS